MTTYFEVFGDKLRGFTKKVRTLLRIQNQEEIRGMRRDVKDPFLNALYSVVTWKDPTITWSVLIALHFIFWLSIQLEIRFYGLIALVLLKLVICDVYIRCYLPHLTSANIPYIFEDIYGIFADIFVYLRNLRKENPASFCLIMSIALLTTSLISNRISGYTLTYMFILIIFFGPLWISKLPEGYLLQIREKIRNFSNNSELITETELMQFIPRQFTERDNDLDSLLTDKTTDSLTNSLISGITSMPAYNEVDGNNEIEIEEEDLEPRLYSRMSFTRTPDIFSSDSDSELQMRERHFCSDSSSEEEKSFGRGLEFYDGCDMETANGILDTLSQVGTSVATSVATHLTGTVRNASAKPPDSDSEFEFINSDELDERS